MSNPIAVPGSNVATGSLITPGGAQGVQGIQGPTSVSADSGNIAQLGSDNLILVPQSQIWSVRLRSFNTLSNPGFELDARTAGTGISFPVTSLGGFVQDRWYMSHTVSGTGTRAFGCGQAGMIVNIPGTSYAITNKLLFLQLNAQQATLAAGDYDELVQWVEGPSAREIVSDVHSLSILAQTNVAGGLKFSVAIRDQNNNSLVKLCTLTAANVWQLLTFPNLPKFPAALTLTPGNAGYTLTVSAMCGSGQVTTANDVWVAGNFIGAIGMDNLASKPVNSYLYLSFIQHEPGSQCTTLIDKPFSQNLDECQRYFQKTGYPYATKPGTVDTNDPIIQMCQSGQSPYQWVPFKKSMAKTPTMTFYNPNSGAANSVRNNSAGTDLATSGAYNLGTEGFAGPLLTSPPSTGIYAVSYHYTADTGW